MHYPSPRRRTRLPFRLHALAAALAAAGASTLAPMSAQAQPPVVKGARDYTLPAAPLATTLNRIAVDAALTLSVDPALVQGKQSNPVRGKFEPEAALREALRGTGLGLSRTAAGTFTLQRLPPQGAPVTLQTMKINANAESLFADIPESRGFKAELQSSATKMPLSLKETPQAISVVTQDSMEARQVRDLTSALEMVAGVGPSGGSTTGGPFAGRGLAQGEAFVLRGQELSDFRDVRIDGFTVPASNYDMSAFERVDVVKGPSSTMYGQGSLGGFINLVRKKPQSEYAAVIAAQVGSWDTYRGEFDVTGPMGETANGRVVASYDDGKSFIDGVETQREMVAPNLEINFTERTRLLVDLLYQAETFVPSHGVPLRPEGRKLHLPDIPRSRYSGVAADKSSSSEDLLVTSRIDHEISDKWLATLLLQQSKQSFRRFFDNYAHGGLAANGDTYVYTDTAHLDRDGWAGELRVEGHFDAFDLEHSLIAGVERNYRKDRTAFGYQQLGFANLYANTFDELPGYEGAASVLPFNYDNDTIIDNEAVYTQLALSLTQRTKLIVGMRYDESEQNNQNNQTGEEGDALDSDKFTKRIAVTHAITGQINAYAGYAESFNPLTDVAKSGNLLDPETGEGYEIGLKTEWFERRLGVNVAVFRQDLVDTAIPDPTDIDFSINGGEQRTEGVELEIVGAPVAGLEVGLAASVYDAEYTDRADPYYGMKPYAFAEEQYSVFASYELQGGTLRGFGVGATVVAVGDRYLGYPGMSEWVGGAEDEVVLDGYERVDLHVFYKGLKQWEFSLQARNVTDEVYIERFRDIESNNYFGSPTAYLLRVEYRL